MYVIIGGSTAAAGCIEGIRKLDQASPITLVTDETVFNYGRPLISYLLCGKTTEEKMTLRPADFFAQNNVCVKSGVRAEQVDTAAKTVRLSNGETLCYEKLLLAAGSRPFTPPIAGLDSVKKRFSFMTLADAKALCAALTPESRVLILGAGLTGVKCAEGIAARCKSVAIADMAPRVLPAVLDDEAAAMVQKHMEAHGVRFYFSDAAASFEEGCATLQSGTQVPFDILVTAVGVRPNVELLRDAGAAVQRGVCVDAQCCTSLPDVFAAGDCAEGPEALSGEKRLLPLWPSAAVQGEVAGACMAGGNAAVTGDIAINATGVFGLHMVTAGSYDGESYVEKTGDCYKRLITKDGTLQGVILVGDVARAGIYTNLIRTAKPLAEIDFDLIRKSPQLMAFSKSDRAKQLGGAV